MQMASNENGDAGRAQLHGSDAVPQNVVVSAISESSQSDVTHFRFQTLPRHAQE